jgi:membrane protein
MTHERPRLWSIGLLALLLAAGLRRQWHSETEQRSQTGATPLDDGHGRSATTPSEIPVRGWKDILLRVYEGISEDRILASAAAVTFYTLLALFPGIAALVSIYGLFADPSSMANQLDAASGILPSGAVEVIRDQLTRLTSQGSRTLGISFVIGLVIALWRAMSRKWVRGASPWGKLPAWISSPTADIASRRQLSSTRSGCTSVSH